MSDPRIIKRYPNRKLYDTARSKYVTLQDVSELVQQGIDVHILDNDTNEDITGLTLAQILLDSEKKKRRTLPLSALKQLLQSGGTFLQKKITQPVANIREEAERTVSGLRGGAERRLRTLRDKSAFDELRATVQELVQQTQQNLEDFQRRLQEGLTGILPGSAKDARASESAEQAPDTREHPSAQHLNVQAATAVALGQVVDNIGERLAALEHRLAALEVAVVSLGTDEGDPGEGTEPSTLPPSGR